MLLEVVEVGFGVVALGTAVEIASWEHLELEVEVQELGLAYSGRGSAAGPRFAGVLLVRHLLQQDFEATLED